MRRCDPSAQVVSCCKLDDHDRAPFFFYKLWWKVESWMIISRAEPLKKKKRMDPAILRAREARRQRKLEKQIRRLLKNARQLKPIDECQVPICIVDKPRYCMKKLSWLWEWSVEVTFDVGWTDLMVFRTLFSGKEHDDYLNYRRRKWKTVGFFRGTCPNSSLSKSLESCESLISTSSVKRRL